MNDSIVYLSFAILSGYLLRNFINEFKVEKFDIVEEFHYGFKLEIPYQNQNVL